MLVCPPAHGQLVGVFVRLIPRSGQAEMALTCESGGRRLVSCLTAAAQFIYRGSQGQAWTDCVVSYVTGRVAAAGEQEVTMLCCIYPFPLGALPSVAWPACLPSSAAQLAKGDNEALPGAVTVCVDRRHETVGGGGV